MIKIVVASLWCMLLLWIAHGYAVVAGYAWGRYLRTRGAPQWQARACRWMHRAQLIAATAARAMP